MSALVRVEPAVPISPCLPGCSTRGSNYVLMWCEKHVSDERHIAPLTRKRDVQPGRPNSIRHYQQKPRERQPSRTFTSISGTTQIGELPPVDRSYLIEIETIYKRQAVLRLAGGRKLLRRAQDTVEMGVN
ncbi:uncharacterized protein LOC118511840 [Anopheles stephensi]|uniref:uncharacterized protein LOC118511840 n=1 Tax=Anopheles stephensi TaxID=30069 RepID=UPI001658BB36|nr:uncharacterized protein LOC118511840 [Anopheles stephensi]